MKNESFFSIEELSASETAKRLGIDNTPSADAVKNMQRLINRVLDPARKALGMPITVNSGFRSPALNAAVGGAARSYHLSGRAADLNAGSRKLNLRLYDILKNLPHVELLNEQNATWIHVAL